MYCQGVLEIIMKMMRGIQSYWTWQVMMSCTNAFLPAFSLPTNIEFTLPNRFWRRAKRSASDQLLSGLTLLNLARPIQVVKRPTNDCAYHVHCYSKSFNKIICTYFIIYKKKWNINIYVCFFSELLSVLVLCGEKYFGWNTNNIINFHCNT